MHFSTFLLATASLGLVFSAPTPQSPGSIVVSSLHGRNLARRAAEGVVDVNRRHFGLGDSDDSTTTAAPAAATSTRKLRQHYHKKHSSTKSADAYATDVSIVATKTRSSDSSVTDAPSTGDDVPSTNTKYVTSKLSSVKPTKAASAGTQAGYSTPVSISTATSAAAVANGAYWKPTAGTRWNIVLNAPLVNTDLDVDAYNIDLDANPVSTIQGLVAKGKHVICYFSAGSYENFRPDSKDFLPADKGAELDGWPGEFWLQTDSANVRSIMTKRMDRAKAAGCSGIDPDNVDGFANKNGVGLTQASSVDFITFLANEAHARGLSIGLKNNGAVIPQVIDFMEWSVNEQCEEFNECTTFEPFIAANKPVFHIEYPSSAPSIDASVKSTTCSKAGSGFSTLLKEMSLSDWVDAC